jgi:hypothetical protein
MKSFKENCIVFIYFGMMMRKKVTCFSLIIYIGKNDKNENYYSINI